jgi:hypothetical protein
MIRARRTRVGAGVGLDVAVDVLAGGAALRKPLASPMPPIRKMAAPAVMAIQLRAVRDRRGRMALKGRRRPSKAAFNASAN